MLTYLGVKNITVIESAGLEFTSGLNVITGETGAGKSVLVGALKFLTGDRLNRAVLRDPSQKMFVEGIFSSTDSIDKEIKEQYDIEDELILSRQADETGKNKVSVNGRVAPVTTLKDVCQYLIDIHGQNENQFLFNPSKHLEFIDFFVADNIKNDYENSYNLYRKKANELSEFKKQIEESNKMKEMYEFQIEEITSLNLDVEKDSKIEEKIEFLSHIEKIRESSALCLNLLKEGEISALDLIGKSEKTLSNICNLAPELNKAQDFLMSASSNLNDAVSYIEQVFSQQESSPDELNVLIDRKYKLQTLFKKYGKDIESVIAYKESIEEKLKDSLIGDEKIKALEKEESVLKNDASEKAKILNDERKSVSEKISVRICDILKELELPSSKFFVKFTNLEFLDRKGGVEAEFYISTNAGFEAGPLSTVASGGEISRVMLALKEVFAEADSISTLLFDEIDTGISGKAAKSVADKLKSLSKKKQIIVITHLPVVAALGDSHFHISKKDKEGVSRTDIMKIDGSNRENVIATMIAGEVTDNSVMQARELLKGAKL